MEPAGLELWVRAVLAEIAEHALQFLDARDAEAQGHFSANLRKLLLRQVLLKQCQQIWWRRTPKRGRKMKRRNFTMQVERARESKKQAPG